MKSFKKICQLLFLLILLTPNCEAKNVKTDPRKKEFFGLNQRDAAVIFMKDFYKWYKTKYDYLDHRIFPVNIDVKKPIPYKINFHETEKYLSVLKSSGFFSDNYINYYRNYFKKIDLILQKTKQNDGPVDGLDYDLIMNSQEPESYLEDLNIIQLNIKKSSVNSAIVKMKTKYNQDTYQLIYLVKMNHRYLIDKIEFINKQNSGSKE